MDREFSSKRPLTAAEEAEIQSLIASDPDAPEATEAQLAVARPFGEAFPVLMESIRRSRGRPAVESPKRQISIRLSPEVVEAYKATGKGWQVRMEDALRKAIGL